MRFAPPCLAVSLWVCSATALAETPKAASAVSAAPRVVWVDSLTGEAKASQQEGKTLFERGDWAGASLQFERAYAGSSDPRMLWNVALAEKGQKHIARALSFVQRFVKERGKALTPLERKDSDELRRALEALVSKLKLTVSEPDAQVFVDDQPVGFTPIPAPIAVDPGTKRIRVSKPGFKVATETETFTIGSTVLLEISLQPDLHEGRLHVKADPNATVWLDGRVVGQGDWEAPVTSGHHYVSVTAPGKRSYETETVIHDAEARDLRVTLQEDASDHGGGGATALWIAGGAALLAGVAVGGYFLLKPSTSEPASPVSSSFGAIQLPLSAH